MKPTNFFWVYVLVCLFIPTTGILAQDPNNPPTTPTVAQTYRRAGNTALLQRRYTEAINYYETAVQLDPTMAEDVKQEIGVAWLNLGVQMFNMGDYETALSHYTEALNYIPQNPILHNNIGFTLFRMGELAESVLGFQQAITLRPDYITPWTNLANTLLALEQYESALYTYEQAIRLGASFDAVSYSNYCVALTELRLQPEVAVDACESAINMEPSNALYWGRAAHTLVVFGELNQAFQVLEIGLQLNPNMPLLYRVLGDAYAAQGDKQRAESAYRRALELHPENIKAQQGLSILLGTPLPPTITPQPTFTPTLPPG